MRRGNRERQQEPTEPQDPMRPSRRSRSAPVTMLILNTVLSVISGCASSSNAYPASSPSRSPTGTPEQFMVGTIPPGGTLTQPQANGSCRNPMVDPRDGTQLMLVQSQPGAGGQVGDYAVPEGGYGARPGELLRMDCGTGRAIGLVPRRA